MKLKTYQENALGTLSDFLTLCRDRLPENAFAQMQPEIPYRNPDNQWPIPYVCMRIPTGGGKTLLAAHTVSRAAKDYLDCERPVVLWLVPSKTIKAQTVEALNNRQHAYRLALDDAFNREVTVIDAEQFTQLKPQDWGNKTIVVVSTIQNFRVDDTSGRKIYAHHEQLEPHFARLPENVLRDLEKIGSTDIRENGLQAQAVGKVKCSFANLLAANRPLVIVDEAHNARTALTFETLRRVHPAAIVEFTATPNTDRNHGSNIIYHVGAAALKAEEMIKLPIYVQDHSGKNWQEIVDRAVLQRADLAQKAQLEADYIRPIVLFQAENKNGTVTVDVLRDYLSGSLHIAPEKIAVVTGAQRELDGINLLSPDCPVEFVITVEALKEGWDCPFAYVLCSLQNVSSAKDAEQLLGRVLRMPYAKRRMVEDLNWAYAHLLSPKFGAAAGSLTDKLVNMGFNHLEIAKILRNDLGKTDDLFDGYELPSIGSQTVSVFELASIPDVCHLPEEQREQIKLTTQEDGSATVQISGSITPETEKLLLQHSPSGKRREALKTQIAVHNQKIELNKSPSQRGEIFPKLPQVCLKFLSCQDELDLFEPKLLLNILGWNINDYPAELDFQVTDNDVQFSIDLDNNETVEYRQTAQQLSFNHGFLDFTDDDLVNWLDRNIEHDDTPQQQMLPFLQRVVRNLLAKPNVKLADLLQNKFALARAVDGLMNRYREQAMAEAYQQTLFNDAAETRACLSEQFCYEFSPENYEPQSPFYSGHYRFAKHFFPEIENLKAQGEEFDCAQIIDTLPEIKYWIRNPDLGKRGFWLPLSGVRGNRFFPDFICELKDGRILVLEYKGEAYKTNDDSKEKCLIGKHWAQMSEGRCLFAMIVERDEQGRNMRQQILGAIQS